MTEEITVLQEQQQTQQTKNKYKVMAFSDSPVTITGFATCTKDVMNYLCNNGFDGYFLAHNYPGQTLPPGLTFQDNTKLDFSLIGCGMRAYCEDVLEFHIKDKKPNVLFICLDTFMLYPWFLGKNLTPAKTIFHYPSDGEGGLPRMSLNDDCIRILQKCDLPVAMSKFAQKQVEKTYGIKTPYIPLGVHTDIYNPLSQEERNDIRNKTTLFMIDRNRQTIAVNNVMNNKFVIGSVFRNQPRKFADRLIKTAKILQDKYKQDDFILVLHADPNDAAAPYSLSDLAWREGVGHRVFFTGMTYYNGFTLPEMNKVYNSFDIFALLTSGEGFGLPFIEAMSCGIPVVGTNYTCVPEFILDDGQCGEVVNILGFNDDVENNYHNGEITGSWSVERGLADCQDAALKIMKLKNNRELRERYSIIARDKALKIYDYKVIMPQWKEIITNLIEK